MIIVNSEINDLCFSDKSGWWIISNWSLAEILCNPILQISINIIKIKSCSTPTVFHKTYYYLHNFNPSKQSINQ